MPIELRFSEDGSRVDAMCFGPITGADLLDVNGRIYSPECLPRLRVQLVDLTESSGAMVTVEEARQCAEQDRRAAEQKPGMIIAIVAPEDAQFGTARLWEAHVSGTGLQTMVFRSRDAAECWIEAKRQRGEGGVQVP